MKTAEFHLPEQVFSRRASLRLSFELIARAQSIEALKDALLPGLIAHFGARLCVSSEIVKAALKGIFRKLEVRSRAQVGGARVAVCGGVKTSFGAASARQALLGTLLILVSLPFLWILHRTFGLGNPPLAGILTLGGAVILSFAGAGAIGAGVGVSHGNTLLAGVLSLLLGAFISAGAAPLYGSMVVDDLTREAAGVVWNERERITGGAQNALTTRAGETLSAVRQGKLRDELSSLQTEAKNAASPTARDAALQKARQITLELAQIGKERGIGLLKSGVARSSAFALLFWTILGAPLAGIFEAKRARRY